MIEASTKKVLRTLWQSVIMFRQSFSSFFTIITLHLAWWISASQSIFIYDVQGGKGLHATINSHSKKFVGILNGIDTDAWNPASDNFLKVQYSASDREGKLENKEALRRLLGLSSSEIRRPLVRILKEFMFMISVSFFSSKWLWSQYYTATTPKCFS